MKGRAVVQNNLSTKFDLFRENDNGILVDLIFDRKYNAELFWAVQGSASSREIVFNCFSIQRR